MACKCLNDEGNPRSKCLGTCKITLIEEQAEQQHRDPLNGFAELIHSQVEKQIDYRLMSFKIELQDQLEVKMRQAFLDGIKEGIKLFYDVRDLY